MTDLTNGPEHDKNDQEGRQEGEKKRLLALCEELKVALTREQASRERKAKLTPTLGEIASPKELRDYPQSGDQ
jgi:hypothetical protein